jgi:hypothetical protein
MRTNAECPPGKLEDFMPQNRTPIAQRYANRNLARFTNFLIF